MTNNNKNSNGPKTDEGKATSSRNSITHGLTARRWLNANEQSLYDETIKNLIVDFDPQTYIEKILITKMAECLVRLMRIQKVEDAMFDLASDEAGNSDYICKASVAMNLIIKDFIAREANQSYFIDVRVSFLGCDESKKDDALTIDEILKDSHEISSTSLQKYFKNLKIRIINDLQVQTVLRDSTERIQLLKDAAMPDTQKLHLVQRYRTADERQFSKALGELLELQKRRKTV
jgi:hypothetical protein